MYIEPNSRLVLLSDVPLNPRQTDTYYFGSASEQFNTLYARRIAEFTRQSYQRVERGRMRVEINAERVYSCNYCMFQNSAYGSKWFYAFVTGVEYINDVTTEIIFQIDDIQTWFFEHNVPPCYVERQHSTTDGIGDNIEPEPVNAGDLVPNDYTPLHRTYDFWGNMNDRMILISWINPTLDIGDYEIWVDKGQLVNGTFTTGEIKVYNGDNEQEVAEAAQFIKEQMQEHPESIVAMYMAPRWAVGKKLIEWLPYSREGVKYNYQLPALNIGASLNGYIPKNNKLYTYPYNALKVDAGSSDSICLRYEFFNNFTPTFLETWNVLEPVSSALRPTNYRGITAPNMDISLTLSGFPMCMWSGDAYKAWVAQNSVDIGSTILKTLGGFILGTLMGGPVGGFAVAGTQLASQAASLISQNHKASIAADITGGRATGNNTWAHDMLDYYASRVSCTRDQAEAIDGYFTAFGYAQNKVQKPIIRARRNFTYVKTVGATVTGALPADSKAAIATMYDNGIRFWTTAGPFGNMGVDNPVL